MDHRSDLNLRDTAWALVLQGALTVLFLVVLLQLWRTDLRVPFSYWGDTLLQLAVVKNIADGGWIWSIDRLGAPFSLPMAAFPQNLTTTSIVLEALSIFSKEPGLLLNVYWLLTIVLASVNAHLSLRVMGYRTSSAVVLAALYAMLPYAFYRNVGHLPLVYPFIPVLAAFAVQVASDTAGPLTSRWGKYVLICAIAQGFEYVYYSFFSVFVFIVAGLLAYSYHNSWLQARRAWILCAVLTISSIVNLAPSLLEWNRHGKPPNTSYKTPAEAELYGLKLRQLLSPVQPSHFGVIRAFGQQEKQFPNENENETTRLGTILSIGLLGMFAQYFFRRRISPQVRAASVLTLASFLLATVGGFGAIFNLLVTPDIRAYNRIIVFIAFFIIVYLAQVIDNGKAWLGASFPHRTARWSSVTMGLALAAGLLFGMLDQGQAAQLIVERYASDAASFREERVLVAEIERRHPAGGPIMQLPETAFPSEVARVNMLIYDNGRPYLASTKLSWSWPSFSDRREHWYGLLGNPSDPAFLSRLVTSGFVGIWLDRYGYDPAELATLEGTLTARLGTPLVGGIAQRYAYFELPSLQRSTDAAGPPSGPSAAERAKLLNPLLMKFGPGFYPQEQNGDRRHRWSRRESTLRVQNDGDNSTTAAFHALIRAGQNGVLRIAIDGRPMEGITFSAGEAIQVSIPVQVSAESYAELAFAFDGPPLIVPADGRTLYFAVVNPRIEER